MRYHRVRFPALIRALGRALLLYLCVLTLTFTLLRLAPGDAATFLVPPGASANDAARMRSELGLDRSTAVQYARWLRGSLGGQFGTSFVAQRSVRAVIGEALPISVALGGLSLLLSFVVGTAAGLLQAARRGSRTDAALTIASVVVDA